MRRRRCDYEFGFIYIATNIHKTSHTNFHSPTCAHTYILYTSITDNTEEMQMKRYITITTTTHRKFVKITPSTTIFFHGTESTSVSYWTCNVVVVTFMNGSYAFNGELILSKEKLRHPQQYIYILTNMKQCIKPN